MSIWTDERIEQLKALWADDLSCSQIARAMDCGLSRNAIIGKANRMGLPKRSDPANRVDIPKKPRVERPQGKRAPRPKPQREPTPDLPADIGSLAAYETGPIPEDFRGLTLLDLKHDDCRYPRGGDGTPTLFCGQPRIDGSSYCASCHRRCHAGFVRGAAMNLSDAERARRVHQGRVNNARRRAA